MACIKPELTKVRNIHSSGTCRVCMRKSNLMKTLFSPDSKIVERILFCTGILLTENPILPSFICPECYSQLNIAHNFKTTCIESENSYRQLDVKVDVKIEELDKPAAEKVEYLYEDEAVINDLHEAGLINKNIPEPTTKVFKTENTIPMTNTQTVRLKVVHVTSKAFELLCKEKKKIQKEKKITENNDNEKKIPRKRKRYIQYIFRKLSCVKCNIKFDTEEESIKHHQDVHNMSKHICEICGKQLFSYSGLRQHMLTHKEAKFQCAHCSYSTAHKTDLVTHLTIHTGEKKYQCHACPLRFRTSSNLHAHMRFKHLGKRPFSCDNCDKSFVSQDCLQKHSVTHSQTRRYACNFCDSRFNGRGIWKRHLLSHHAVRVPREKPGPRRNYVDKETPSLFYKENDKIKNNLSVK